MPHVTVIGSTTWVIPEGYIPQWSHGPAPQMESHETACLLNLTERDTEVRITIFFSDRDPIPGYIVRVPRCRTLHLRFNDLDEPLPIPRRVDFASLFESDQPIVVPHTRLDTRQAEGALMTTLAYAAKSSA